MRKAVRQLGSHIISPLPDGIAVSSVTYGDQIRCFAVETRGKGEASYRPNWKTKDVRWGADEHSWSAENGEFLAAALRETWGRLAEFGGNVEAHSTWSGPRDEEDADAHVDFRERSEVQTPYGQAIGVTETVTVADLRLSVTRAIDASVDSALSSGDPALVTAAQSNFAERIERPGGDQLGTVSQTFSAAPDGSIFLLAR
jgi:hypothetical protein